ncbi:MAG TPA: hypothetical protein VN932_01730, partial [Rhizomicrobium sp.]|nr:hypothetical protein [Rhizomicrobium sp.]
MDALADKLPEGTAHPVRKALAARLVERGKLAPAGLERAERLAIESGEPLELVLTRLGLTSERDIAETFAALLEISVATPKDYPDEPVLEDRLSRKFLREVQLIPLDERSDALVIAMVDPLNDYAVEAARFAAGKPVIRLVAFPADF